jgi:predicted  nucleic acid-binding Zn-ribbon protein
MPEANTKHHTNAMYTSEPSSPAFVDHQAPLIAEIKELKAKLEEVNGNFAYYEESNAKLEERVEKQAKDIEQKDLELVYLKEHAEINKKEHDATHSEVVKLRRQSSTFEKIVESNERELRSLPDLERTIEDREAEVRNFSAELTTVRTERDDKVTEVKGLEGDIAELRQELLNRDQEIDGLLERLDVIARHITVTKDLSAEELDDVLYEFMEKWTAMRADGPIRKDKKDKRASIGGMNLADEFEALGDDEDYDSQDGGYNSDANSIRSVVSAKLGRKIKPTLGLSEVESIAIYPSIKPLPQNTSCVTQTTPISSPKRAETTSTETQTSPIASPKKRLSQVISSGVQTSPIAALIQKFTFSDVSSGVNTSPVAASPKTAVLESLEEVFSRGVHTSPVAASVEEKQPFSEVISSGVETSPVAPSSETAAPESFSETITSGVQTSPVAPSATPFSEIISSGVQTSPIASSPVKPTSPRKSFAEVLTSGVQTSPISPSPKTAARNTSSADAQTSPIGSSPSSIPLPPSPAAKSPISSKSPITAKSTLSNEVTSDQITPEAPQPAKPSRINTLNIKRPRVPTKDMSPATLSHYKSLTTRSATAPMLAPNTPTSPNPNAKIPILTLLSNTATPLAKDFLSTFLANWLLILCLFFSVFAGSYLGASTANTAAEWSWANANGYAPESKGVYITKSVPGHLGAMVWGVLAWEWNLVFGNWFVGAGTRVPLSPG